MSYYLIFRLFSEIVHFLEYLAIYVPKMFLSISIHLSRQITKYLKISEIVTPMQKKIAIHQKFKKWQLFDEPILHYYQKKVFKNFLHDL